VTYVTPSLSLLIALTSTKLCQDVSQPNKQV
jgi:hypothetical protein